MANNRNNRYRNNDDGMSGYRFGQSRRFDRGDDDIPYGGYETSNDRYESSADQNYQRYSGTGGYGRVIDESGIDYTGRGPKGWKRSDDRIKEDVSERLESDRHIDASEIEVQVRDGVVTLAGSVEDRRMKRHAEDIIENLPGVADVRNELSIDKSLFEQAREFFTGESSKEKPESRERTSSRTRH